ncbi:unnamed protein product, partial [Didymodactylos carnosus]
SVLELVTHVRKCHKQSLLSVNVQSYCETRFNGSYLMMNSVLNVFNELPNVISDDQKLNYLTISRDELQLVCLYLEHFDDVIERMNTNVQDKTKTKDSKKLVNPIPKTHIDPLDEIFDKPVVKGKLVKPASSKTELDLYLWDETKPEKETNILNYWKLNQTQYPILAQLAKQILCIPATNMATERLFSYTGGEEFSKRKNSLQSTSSTPQSSPTKRQRTDFVAEEEENMDDNNDND